MQITDPYHEKMAKIDANKHLSNSPLQSNSSRERYHSGIYNNNAGLGQVSPSSHLLSPYNAVACGI